MSQGDPEPNCDDQELSVPDAFTPEALEGDQQVAGAYRPNVQMLPTEAVTKEALDAIQSGRATTPSRALREMAIQVIETMTKIDRLYHVSRYLKEVRIVCKGSGVFALEIFDKNATEDPDQFAKDLAKELAARDPMGGSYGKQLRPIELRRTGDEREATGSDGPSAGDVEGGATG